MTPGPHQRKNIPFSKISRSGLTISLEDIFVTWRWRQETCTLLHISIYFWNIKVESLISEREEKELLSLCLAKVTSAQANMWSRTRTLAADAKERCLKTFDSLPVLSFFLGFSGGTLAVFLGGYAMQEQLSRQCKEWRETMLSTRWRLEALGGVPYLLRDEVTRTLIQFSFHCCC